MLVSFLHSAGPALVHSDTSLQDQVRFPPPWTPHNLLASTFCHCFPHTSHQSGLPRAQPCKISHVLCTQFLLFICFLSGLWFPVLLRKASCTVGLKNICFCDLPYVYSLKKNNTTFFGFTWKLLLHMVWNRDLSLTFSKWLVDRPNSFILKKPVLCHILSSCIYLEGLLDSISSVALSVPIVGTV